MKEMPRQYIESRIKSLRRKVRLWFLVDGLSRLIIFLLLYLAFTFWVDYLIRNLPAPLRLCFLALTVIITVWTLINKTIIPVIRLNKMPNDALIFLIEKQFPALKERLINLWQLSEKTIAPQLAQEVTPLSRSFDFTKILFPHPARKLLLGALALLLLSIIAVTFYPSELGIWGKRLLGGNVSWPKRTLLAVKVAPDYTIAKGQNLSVIAWPAKGPRLSAAYIMTETAGMPNSKWERMLLTQAKDRKAEFASAVTAVFRYDFSKVQSPFRFMLKGGDDQTDWIEIKVLDAPSLEKISVSYDYPHYTGMENKTETGGNIKAPAGTKATINAVSNTLLKSASLLLDSNPLPLAVDNNTSISTTITVAKDSKYSLNFVGTNSLKNLDPIEYSIKSIPDSHPAIKVVEPSNEIQYVTPDAAVPLRAIVNDDYGISDSRIIYIRSDSASAPESDNSGAITNASQTFYRYAGPFSNKIELSTALDLKPLNLSDGLYLTLNFIATDNCEVATESRLFRDGLSSPQTTTSSDYSLIIISKPQMAQKIEEAIIQLKDDLKKTVQIQEAARQAPDIQPSLTNQRRVTQELNNASAMLANILKDISINKLFSADTTDKLASVQDTLSKLANAKSPAVQQSLEKASATKDPGDDQIARAEAEPKQAEIADNLKTTLNTLEQWEDYQEVINNVRDLLSETRNLSERIKKPLSDEPSSRELEKDRLNEQAQNLRKESDNLSKKMARVADKLKDSHPYYSDKLKTGLEKLQADNNLNNNLLSLLSDLASSLAGQAINDAGNIQNSFSALLDFLEDRVSPEEIQKKLAELKKMMEQVSALKNEEEKLFNDTAGVLDPTGRISAVAQELDSLLLDQKALKEVTAKALAETSGEKLDDILKKLAEEQQSLKDQAKAMADRLTQANSQLKPANPDVQEAGKSLQASSDKMSQANQDMAKSAQQPTAENKQQSTEKQKDALQDLRQARESLKKFLNRQLAEEEKRKLERLAKRQKEIKEATEKAAKESDNDSRETLQGAAQKMSQAQNNLSGSKPQDAQEDEQAALEELERLYETLANKIDELEQRKKQDQLEKLSTMLKNILDPQADINIRTSEILDKAELNRQDALALKKLSTEQLHLADNAMEIKKKLDAEKSTAYSYETNNIRDEMQTVAKLLAGPSPKDDSNYIREIQADIIKKGRELLTGLKTEMNNRKPLQAEGQGMDEEDKLISELAELKMTKTIQEEIISRTEALKKELLKDPDNPDPALNALLQRLSSEQGHLAEMIKELTKLIKEKKARHQNP
ncbi:MAG: hypothetical protein HZA49_01935 [Planctomycetes bacterium]|nr:hypothetical protein [Planctomycetota bacterium]